MKLNKLTKKEFLDYNTFNDLKKKEYSNLIEYIEKEYTNFDYNNISKKEKENLRKFGEKLIFEYLTKYSFIKGIQEGDISEELIKKLELENCASDKNSVDGNRKIKILGKEFKLMEGESLNKFMDRLDSKKLYFFFPNNNGFVYGDIKKINNSEEYLRMDIDVRTYNLMNLYYFKKKKNNYFIKDDLNFAFETLLKLFDNNYVKEALSTLGITNRSQLLNREEEIKLGIAMKSINPLSTVLINYYSPERDPVTLFLDSLNKN